MLCKVLLGNDVLYVNVLYVDVLYVNVNLRRSRNDLASASHNYFIE